MKERSIIEKRSNQNLSVEAAVLKVASSLQVELTEVYKALPDLLRLSEEEFEVGPLPAEFRSSETNEQTVMLTSTGTYPLGIILKKTEHGLQTETFREYWNKVVKQQH